MWKIPFDIFIPIFIGARVFTSPDSYEYYYYLWEGEEIVLLVCNTF